jgi:hypothetical protein
VPLPGAGKIGSDQAKRGYVPLGQLTCADWNAASGADARADIVSRIRGFAGGVVNDGSHDIGTGATLSDEDARRLYDGWCTRSYAEAFLLYKLYTHGAVFANRD